MSRNHGPEFSTKEVVLGTVAAVAVAGLRHFHKKSQKLEADLDGSKWAFVQAIDHARQKNQQVEELSELANRDPRTGLSNVRALEGTYERLGQSELLPVDRRHDRDSSSNNPTSLILIDLDNFKSINDKHRHAGGNKVLKAVGAAMTGRLRERDLAARLGDESDEFAALLPRTTEAQAKQIAEDLNRLFSEKAKEIGIDFTTSMGVGVIPLAHPEGFDGAAKDVDEALYAAKDNGRNGIVVLSEMQVISHPEIA